jgi:hypothetical protein
VHQEKEEASAILEKDGKLRPEHEHFLRPEVKMMTSALTRTIEVSWVNC